MTEKTRVYYIQKIDEKLLQKERDSLEQDSDIPIGTNVERPKNQVNNSRIQMTDRLINTIQRGNNTYI